MKQKILSLLVALFAMTTGAWADEATITLKCGTTEKTYENVTLPWSTTADILKAVVTDLSFNVNINAISGGDGKVVKYGNENFTVNGTFSGNATVTVTYNTGSSATITVTAPAPLIALDDTKTEATMAAMPAYDVTVDYELVRDLATSTKVDLIIGTGSDAVTATADTRLRIAKSNNVYAPVSALSCNFVDQIENNTILPTGFDDAKLTPQFYLQGENDAWTLVTDINTTTKLPNNLQPGQVYCITLKAADGSYYDGETQPSFTVTLFEGYEVKVPAGEYVTFYKDEPLYADPVSSADAVLYTISSVSTTDGTATLSDAIATAPSSTPLLVYNSNTSQDKTFLLIPADAEPNLALTVAREFTGTLTGTTIAASTSTKSNYALNGKQFVWVKNQLDIAANKAYLSVTTGGQLHAPALNIVFDDNNMTGIGSMVNGQSSMVNGDWYDLNGRKLNAKPTTKGVYIQNGKKVVIK